MMTIILFLKIVQNNIMNTLIINKNRKRFDALGFNQCEILANGLIIEYMGWVI